MSGYKKESKLSRKASEPLSLACNARVILMSIRSPTVDIVARSKIKNLLFLFLNSKKNNTIIFSANVIGQNRTARNYKYRF